MTLKNGDDFPLRSLFGQGIPLCEFRFRRASFRLSSDEPGDDEEGRDLPAIRDDGWQAMLRMALGCVPKGAEHAPPCNCELHPIAEKYDFSGLAGLPPSVRLMDGFFPVRDQSKRGACFAFALVALCEYMLGKRVELSEQSLFHFTKLVTPGKVETLRDGAFTLDAIHAIEEYGICPLSEWHYNPESWNYVEDPDNVGQGLALQKKLAAAQKYRFHNWRMLSEGSVLQFKQTLSARFPVYTGVSVTTDWDDGNVRETGVIPYPKLFWRVRVAPPPIGLVLNILAENEVEPDEETVGRCSKKLMAGTLDYLSEAVFQAPLTIIESNEEDDGLDLVVHLDKLKGTGHAMCLVGYADDKSYAGGGYFIARNSWSDTRWGSKSPEKPGYALIPYAYIADYGNEGVAMSEFPELERDLGGAVPPLQSAVDGMRLNVSSSGFGTARPFRADAQLRRTAGAGAASMTASVSRPFATSPASTPVGAPAVACDGFEAWLAARRTVLEKPKVDESKDVLLRPGTPVLLPDPMNSERVLRDTPENLAKLRAMFMAEVAAAKKERLVQEVAAAKAREAALLDTVKDVVDGLISDGTYSIRPEDVLEDVRMLDFDGCGAKTVRAAMLALQSKAPERYALCVNRFGREEFRPASALGGNRRVEA